MIRISFLVLILFVSNTAFSADLKTNKPQITTILENIKTQQGYPGISLAVSFDGEIYTDTIGYANISEKKSINSETIFRIYSLTKGLTDILSNILVENDTLILDTPIKSYLPELPLHLQEITSQQLLSHRSGIRHYASIDEWLRLSQNHCSTPSDAYAPFYNDPLVSEVGTKENYSSFGYVLLSGVLEAATGESFINLMNTNIIEPSGSERVEFDNPERNMSQNVTKYYELSNGKYIEAISIDNSCKFGGGAINSTPTDIAKIFNSYFSGSLTNKNFFQVASSLPNRLSLSGEGLGGRSALVAYPKEKLTVVIMANARGGNLQPYANEIAEQILANK